MDLRETYNRIAEDWHADHQNDDWHACGTDTLLPFLKAGGSVLDVGCGGGMKSRYFVKKGFHVVGIDFSENMIAIAKREVPSGEFYALDLHKAGTLDRMFDCIFMQAVLLHVPRQKAGDVIKAMKDLLNIGGYMYIAVKDKKPGRGEEEIKKEDNYGYAYERFFSYFSLDEIKMYMQQAGLEIVVEKVTPAGNTRWIEVIGKRLS
ncbi:MAG: hypothetical protein ACD_81C00126G0013 [uncultured bacterium]|uniref:Ubiquinone/menaquinone biosynthesis methyltransferase UbiE n=2 Tax=Candidatus Wolfeibacteriota TaxID=1752735 RepID=A0A0G1HBB5_9BACT|nr:MAG: hypothetical protein ACD_81C00126G0013 [uncultured bacterium]KKR12892.1 MAG: Ubiquinone/menaquinone biosynthesis methyltransferase UbiE [Candidatus Wolfebacteria bacterium GW2011_GWC2_39_22]KKT43823.1 MAG: Ubiquinone/menaquinone biosynthesis methyltransferase UbiE [Candidatus Wolfebacteria bacterium GW2011_GWE2_44_13]HBI25449.1 hypothetical protein [Candidatus Wolfebacteria bacterium]